MSPLDKLAHITIFPTLAATERESLFISLAEFAEMLRTERAPEKSLLRLFCTASFGSKRTAKKSLRHETNIRELFCVVGDADNGVVSVAEAEVLLHQAGIACVLVTTPSHTVERPRWRVLCPLASPLHYAHASTAGFELAEHHKLVSRLAGVFSPGTLAPESWVRSQSWFLGTVDDAPAHSVTLIEDSACLDELIGLDATAQPKPAPPIKVRAKRGASIVKATPIPGTEAPELPVLFETLYVPDEALPLDIPANLSAIAEGAGAHVAMVAIAGKLSAQHVPETTAIDVLRFAADQRPPEHRDAGWHKLRADIPRTVQWAADKAAEAEISPTLTPHPGNGATPPPPPPPPGTGSGGSASPPPPPPQPQSQSSGARGFMRSRNPKFAGNLANVITALTIRPELAGCVAFDEMATGVVLRRPLPGAGQVRVPRPWADHDTKYLQDWLQCHCGMGRVGCEAVFDGVDLVARQATFHPVRDYLSRPVWDSTARLGSWLSTYLGVPPSDFAAATGRMFLIGAVARIFKPGAKADYMLVLEGPQGIFKSQVCVALAAPWVSDQSLDIRHDARAASQHLRGKWLVEVSELAFFKQAEIETLKAFISRTHERYLPRYGRVEVDEPRQCTFIGTTNDASYLHDSTGGRRFWPHCTDKIDIRALIRDRDQLWAETVAAYRAGERWWPEADFEARVIKPEQDARYDADGWTPLVEAYLANKAQVTLIDVFRQALADPYDPARAELPPERFDRRAQLRVREILQNLGWRRASRTTAGRWWIKSP